MEERAPHHGAPRAARLDGELPRQDRVTSPSAAEACPLATAGRPPRDAVPPAEAVREAGPRRMGAASQWAPPAHFAAGFPHEVHGLRRDHRTDRSVPTEWPVAPVTQPAHPVPKPRPSRWREVSHGPQAPQKDPTSQRPVSRLPFPVPASAKAPKRRCDVFESRSSVRTRNWKCCLWIPKWLRPSGWGAPRGQLETPPAPSRRQTPEAPGSHRRGQRQAANRDARS